MTNYFHFVVMIIVDYKLRYITEDQGLGNAFGTSYTMEKEENIFEIGLARVLLDQVYWEQLEGVDKKNQLDVTFCTLYFSSNSCSTCFGQPCAHHQKLTTA
jgi:hypothetical protein